MSKLFGMLSSVDTNVGSITLKEVTYYREQNSPAEIVESLEIMTCNIKSCVTTAHASSRSKDLALTVYCLVKELYFHLGEMPSRVHTRSHGIWPRKGLYVENIRDGLMLDAVKNLLAMEEKIRQKYPPPSQFEPQQSEPPQDESQQNEPPQDESQQSEPQPKSPADVKGTHSHEASPHQHQ